MTLKELAEKLGGNYWEKGNLKRIYLDRGYNTRKMTTKTFVWQNEDGRYLVSCKIECPSQDYNWINSQEQKVKEKVYEDIERALSDKVSVITNENGEYCDTNGDSVELNHYDIQYFHSEDRAKCYIEKETYLTLSYKELERDFFDSEISRLDELEKPQTNSL